MKVFGVRIPFTKQTDLNTVTPIQPTLTIGTPLGIIGEAFAGMWQGNLRFTDTKSSLAFSAVFGCVSLISGDIAKLRLRLMRERIDGTLEEFESPAFSPVLRKPNRYQTQQLFFEQWLLSKLIYGNTYVLKERDARGIVVAQYILDPSRVVPLIAPDGEVYYQIMEDRLAGVPSALPAIPASEIIHDRAKCLFHPLVGVPPLYACALSATQGRQIQVQSSRFFQNMSRPSGQLTAPGTIPEETAKRLKEQFESAFSGDNIGKLLVSGDGLKFEPFTIPPEQAQLIQQLGWTKEDVATAFLVPLYKIAAQKDVRVDPAMKQEYYETCLHPYMQAIESALDDGLRVPRGVYTMFDADELLRLDPLARYEKLERGVKAGVLSPNEARWSENYPPVEGGDSPYLQQQNYSLAALAKRDALDDPFGTAPAAPAQPDPTPQDGEDGDLTDMQAAYLLRLIDEGLVCDA